MCVVCAGIVFEAYSPLGNPGNPFTKSPRILEDTTVKDIAIKHKATPAQVSLRSSVRKELVPPINVL